MTDNTAKAVEIDLTPLYYDGVPTLFGYTTRGKKEEQRQLRDVFTSHAGQNITILIPKKCGMSGAYMNKLIYPFVKATLDNTPEAELFALVSIGTTGKTIPETDGLRDQSKLLSKHLENSLQTTKAWALEEIDI